MEREQTTKRQLGNSAISRVEQRYPVLWARMSRTTHKNQGIREDFLEDTTPGLSHEKEVGIQGDKGRKRV